MRELAKLFLELDGEFEVETAHDAESGLAAARVRRPDAILMDVMMPGTDGIAALGMIRRDPALRDLPVILLSGTVRGPGSERLQGLDVRGVIAKPFDAAALAGQVAALLETP
jgi:Response regulators consisting of a CheY-like receiver domain and a winged-helix DNA-binding domain